MKKRDSGKAEAEKKRREERRRRREEAEHKRQEAREAQLAKNQEVAEEEVRLPAGAQIALRLDMERIRKSPLRASVARLLSEIPDWKMMLSGSDIEPVEHLDRLMVASATLQRGSWLVAGKVHGGTEGIVPITAKMAATRNESATWSSAHGVRTAPWHDDEKAEHVVAVWDPAHFSITRPDDLPRLMAVAGALADADAEKQSVGPTDLANTLMQMAENEAIKVDVEGARRFAKAPGHVVPKSLRLSVLEAPTGAELTARASFGFGIRSTAGPGVLERSSRPIRRENHHSRHGLWATARRNKLRTTRNGRRGNQQDQLPRNRNTSGLYRELASHPQPANGTKATSQRALARTTLDNITRPHPEKHKCLIFDRKRRLPQPISCRVKKNERSLK